MVKKETIAFFPDIKLHSKKLNPYTSNIVAILERKCQIIPIEHLFKNPFFKKVDYVYLNWYENPMFPNSITLSKISYWAKGLLLTICNWRKIKIISVIHNKYPHGVNPDSPLFKKAFNPFFQNLLARSDRVVGVCKATKKVLNDCYGFSDDEKLYYLRLGNYCEDDTDIETEKKKARIKCDLPSNKIVFGCIGRINEYKGVDISIKAFNKLNSEDAMLVISGDCPHDYARYLESLVKVKERVVFDFKPLDDDEVNTLFYSVDVSCWAYKDGSMLNSSSAMHSFSMGTPVISSSNGTVEEMPFGLNYVYHSTSNDEDIEKVTWNMRKAFLDWKTGELKTNSSRLYEVVKHDYSWDRISRDLDELLRFSSE